MKKKVSFGFSKLTTKYKKLIIPCVIIVVIIIGIIVVDKRRNADNNKFPTPTPSFAPSTQNKLLTLKNWTTSYNGVDVSKTVVNVFKIRQLFDSTFLMISTKTLGALYTISKDLSTPSLIVNGPVVFNDFNQYNMNNTTSTYLGLDTTGGGYLSTDLTKIPTTPNVIGSGMIQLIYSQFNDDGNIFACIAGAAATSTTPNSLGTLYVSSKNVTGAGFTAIDGPSIGNKKYSYVKMIELNDGSVLLATLDTKLVMLSNITYKDFTEIIAPPHFNVTDFTQLKDGTVVAVCDYNNVFIKSMSDLTSSYSPWTKINSVNNLPPNLIVKQVVELQDGTITVVCDDGNLYFLSP